MKKQYTIINGTYKKHLLLKHSEISLNNEHCHIDFSLELKLNV